MTNQFIMPEHDWVDPSEAEPVVYPQAEPLVTEGLILRLRAKREWMNATPDPSWDMNQIQRNIGANAVIEYLEQLLEEQRGAPV